MKQLLMGNEAFAHAALAAGVRVVAGYPGTPSSEVVETVARLRASGAANGVHVEWSTNEKAALELLAGASMAGARCLFTCKQVGLNVASDALLSLNYVGVRGGLVLFVADDPGPISSQTEQDTRRFASFAKLPVLDPATPEQGMEMMRYAFDLSEAYGTPVIVRPTTRVCHSSTFVEVQDVYQARAVPPAGFERDDKWIIFPRRAFVGHGEVNERLVAIARDFAFEPFNQIDDAGESARLGIACSGVSAGYVRDALALLAERCAQGGIGLPAYRVLQVGTPYPFPVQVAREFAQGLERIIVFEELDYVVEDELLKLAGADHAAYSVHGKLDGTTLDRGENSTDDCLERLAAFLGVGAAVAGSHSAAFADGAAQQDAPTADAPQAPVRPPVLCAGCPHRASFLAVKKALGKREATLTGDIGCYTLGNAAPLNAIDTCLCMGAGITMAQGLAVAEPHKKHVAFVGDSTFFASGLTGVANAVYNNHDVTIAVLDNSTTAMTGSQPHPGTGDTLMGTNSAPISIEAVLAALGVRCITRANAFDAPAALEAATQAIDFEGPSAVVFTGPCVQLVKPQAAAQVNVSACTGCMVCIRKVGCPAFSFVDEPGSLKGKAMRIDAGLCTGCNLCAGFCPTGAIVPGASGEGATAQAPGASGEGATAQAPGSAAAEGGAEGGNHA